MRSVITFLAIGLGLLVVLSVLRSGSRDAPVAPEATPPAAEAPVEAPAESTDPAAAPPPPIEPIPSDREPGPAATTPADQAPADAPAEAEPIPGLTVAPADTGGPITVSLGEAAPESPYLMRVDLNRRGAAVQQITLSRYAETIENDDRYVIIKVLEAGAYRVYPYAAAAVTVNGTRIDLQRLEAQTASPLWRVTDRGRGHAELRLNLVDDQGQTVAEVVRRYELAEDAYDLSLRQAIINRTDRPLTVAWEQLAQGDITRDRVTYIGDQRKFVTGYFSASDTHHARVNTADAFLPRQTVVDARADGQGPGVWPNPNLAAGTDLAWLAAENRYFAVVTHAAVPPGAERTSDIPPLEALLPRVGTMVFPSAREAPNLKPDDRAVALTLGSPPLTAQPGQPVALDLGIFAGPRKGEVFAEPPYSLMNFDQLIRYELGCTWLTFQWLAHFLLGFLKLIHAVVWDWGLAIIVLVIVVRLLLHPITKRAQINMMKMGKQMQTLQPEIEKLKKKYKDDQTKLNQEMMKLYREKGVNPAGALGCLPMLLQTPIWIALYAMLYFAIELRHQPAFYGVFQAVSGGAWKFLADLSTADHFIKFPGDGFTLNLWLINPQFAAINVLPLLMAVVMFFQQKLTTPPPANEQAAQQQKIMRIMLLLFPVFLYSAPSGLTLYICASTAAGIFDSYLVRKHIREQEEAGTLFDKKPRKPGGFVDRLHKTLEQKQRELEARQGGQNGGPKRSRKK